MVTEFDYPAWVMIAIGVYALAAGIGEFRRPGFWAGMIDDLAGSNALRFLTGLILSALGLPLYLIEPWGSGDIVVAIIKIIGAWMVIEGALFLAFGDWMLKFAQRLMGSGARIWAIFSILIGLAAIVAAELRLASLI